MLNFFHWLFEHPWVPTAFAGAAGGVVRWMTLRTDWREGLAAVIVGGICAVYLNDLAIRIIERTGDFTLPDDSQSLAGFVIGLSGITFTGFVIDLFKGRKPKGGQSND